MPGGTKKSGKRNREVIDSQQSEASEGLDSVNANDAGTFKMPSGSMRRRKYEEEEGDVNQMV